LELEQTSIPLRTSLQTWAAGAVEELRIARPNLVKELSARQRNTCRPLLAIADAAAGGWPERARQAILELCLSVEAQSASFGVLLLGDIREIFREKGFEKIESIELIKALLTVETSPWSEWSGEGEGKWNGKPITALGLSKLLRPYKIRPKTIRVADRTPKGYEVEQFADAFRRYLKDETPPPPSSPQGQSATSATCNIPKDLEVNSIRNKNENVADENDDKYGVFNDVADVADRGVDIEGGSGIPARVAPPGFCYTCRGDLWWRSMLGATICVRCHPAPTKALIRCYVYADGEEMPPD
jgi:putative DNA primase/helicase